MNTWTCRECSVEFENSGELVQHMTRTGHGTGPLEPHHIQRQQRVRPGSGANVIVAAAVASNYIPDGYEVTDVVVLAVKRSRPERTE